MIGMVGEDASRPKQLLGQHRPDEHVRPGRRPEREEEVGAIAQRLVMAIGCADQKAHLAPAGVAPALQFLGKIRRRQGLTPLIKHDRDGVGRRIRELPAAVGKLGDLGRPGDALQIAVGQVSFG